MGSRLGIFLTHLDFHKHLKKPSEIAMRNGYFLGLFVSLFHPLYRPFFSRQTACDISRKRVITSHLISLNKKSPTTWDVGNSVLSSEQEKHVAGYIILLADLLTVQPLPPAYLKL